MSKITNAVFEMIENARRSPDGGKHFAGIIVGDRMVSCQQNTRRHHAEIAAFQSYIKQEPRFEFT